MSENKDKSPDAQGGDQQTPNLQETVKELQGQVTQTMQENARLRGQMEALTPYVQFGGEPSQQAAEPEFDESDPDAVLNHVRSTVDDLQVKTESKIQALEFMIDNPDLKPHVDLVMTTLKSRTNDRKPMKARLDDAAKMVRDQIKAIGEEAVAKAAQAKTQTDAEAAAASAAATGHQGSPEASEHEDEGLSLEDYSAMRQQQSQQATGMW